MIKRLLLMAGAAFVIATPVLAAPTPEQNLTLSPVKQNISIKAGDSYSNSFTLLNGGKSTYTVKIYAAPYSVKDEQYSADFESKKPNTDFYEWVKFSKTSYQLAPNEQVKVDYTVNVPENARPGGHYGVLFAETLPTTGKANFGVSSTQRLGMLAFGKVEGKYEESGLIKSQDIPFFQFAKPLKTTTRVENTGNIDFGTKTEVKVANIFGATKYSKSQDNSVLPGTTRAIAMNWDQVPTLGIYKVSVKTDFLKTNSEKSSYVLMAPIWFYLVVPLLLLGALIYFVQRRRS